MDYKMITISRTVTKKIAWTVEYIIIGNLINVYWNGISILIRNWIYVVLENNVRLNYKANRINLKLIYYLHSTLKKNFSQVFFLMHLYLWTSFD